MVEPGNEIELFSKTAGEVVGALADESGVFKPTRELGEMVAMRLHYRYYPKAVERALGAAEKIKQSGLPRHAYEAIPDPLLRAILVGAAEEEDPSMQERWENLLVNALTVGSMDVTKAFVKVLNDLEPAEAAQLDAWAEETKEHDWQRTRFPVTDARLGMAALDSPREPWTRRIPSGRCHVSRFRQYRQGQHQRGRVHGVWVGFRPGLSCALPRLLTRWLSAARTSTAGLRAGDLRPTAGRLSGGR